VHTFRRPATEDVVKVHPDAEASNALAGIVVDHMGEDHPGLYVKFSFRYGIAGEFLHWLDENRPGWDALRPVGGDE